MTRFVIDVFARVDARFGASWPIPFEAVDVVRTEMWKINEQMSKMPKGGLLQLCSPSVDDFYWRIHDMAIQVKESNLIRSAAATKIQDGVMESV